MIVTFQIKPTRDGWLWTVVLKDGGAGRRWGGVRNDQQSARNAVNARLERVWSVPRAPRRGHAECRWCDSRNVTPVPAPPKHGDSREYQVHCLDCGARGPVAPTADACSVLWARG